MTKDVFLCILLFMSISFRVPAKAGRIAWSELSTLRNLMSRITHVPARLDGRTVHIPLSRDGSRPNFSVIKINGERGRGPVSVSSAKFINLTDAMAAGFPSSSVNPEAFGGTYEALVRQRKRYEGEVQAAISALRGRGPSSQVTGRVRLSNAQLYITHPLHDQPDSPRPRAN